MINHNPTVLVTRQGEGIAEKLKEEGFETILFPLITITPVPQKQIQKEIERIEDYQWIFFTSKNAVKFFFSFFVEELPTTIRIAAIGERTKQAIESFGYEITFVPSAFDGDTFVKEVKEVVHPGEKILFPKGNLARKEITASLKKLGMIVHDVIVYETRLPKDRKEELASLLGGRQVSYIVFASPSAVDNFVDLLGDTNWRKWLQSVQIACIGPVTHQKLIDYGMEPTIVPSTYTFSALVDELVRYEKVEEKK